MPKLFTFLPAALFKDIDLVMQFNLILGGSHNKLVCCLLRLAEDVVILDHGIMSRAVSTIDNVEDKLIILPAVRVFTKDDLVIEYPRLIIHALARRCVSSPF